MTTPANAPQRTAASHHCCNRRASWPPSLSLGRKAALRIYITDAQIPELAEFPPEARRALRRHAFQQMFTRQRWLEWVPNGLCLVGALVGLLTFVLLPRTLYAWLDASQMFVTTGYILLLAAFGGCTGAQLLTHRARRYLRDLIASDAHDKSTAA